MSETTEKRDSSVTYREAQLAPGRVSGIDRTSLEAPHSKIATVPSSALTVGIRIVPHAPRQTGDGARTD